MTERLTTSLRGLWVSGNQSPGNGGRNEKDITCSRCGVTSPDQKPARLASEVVRDPVHCSARKKWEGAQGPRCAQGKGTKGPLFANTEWRRGAFSCSFKVVAATACTRAGSSWLRFFPQMASSNPVSVSRF